MIFIDLSICQGYREEKVNLSISFNDFFGNGLFCNAAIHCLFLNISVPFVDLTDILIWKPFPGLFAPVLLRDVSFPAVSPSAPESGIPRGGYLHLYPPGRYPYKQRYHRVLWLDFRCHPVRIDKTLVLRQIKIDIRKFSLPESRFFKWNAYHIRIFFRSDK